MISHTVTLHEELIATSDLSYRPIKLLSYSPKIMSSNEPKPWKLKVFCWRCWQRREPDDKKKPEQFAARKLVNGKIKSEGLQCHLNMNEDCRRHYWDNLDLRVALHSSSLIEYCPHPKIKEQFNKHKARLNNKARNIGLSIAPYRPVVKPGRVILDSEVMYNQSIEPIDGRLLHSAMYSDEEALQEEEIWLPTDDDSTSVTSRTSEVKLPSDANDDNTGEILRTSEARLPSEINDGTGEISRTPEPEPVLPSEAKDGTGETSESEPPSLVIETPFEPRDLSPALKVKIRLMKIFRDHNIPIAAEKEIYKWAQEADQEAGFSWGDNTSSHTARDLVMNRIYDFVPEIKGGGFKPCLIDWVFKPEVGKKNPRHGQKQVFVRSFSDALRSILTNKTLVKEENLSFPNDETPLSSVHHPVMNNETMITELHHGSWWIDTWNKYCTEGSTEILVPIILYMDGIAIDNASRNTLCPLNFTLGIFNDLTRSTRPDAWETIYFHPQDKARDAIGNLNNLHTGLRCALSSLQEACQQTQCVEWKNLPWNGKTWHVRMKFAVAFVVGDTELHDKLCGHYGCRNKSVAQICRHCNCPTHLCNQPRASHESEYWTPALLQAMFEDPTISNKSISHHPIKNAFHDIDFGVNSHNIHLATPGEKLHMHQLGCAKRAVETFKTVFLDSITKNKVRIIDSIEGIVQCYGSAMTRQSDRDFPRTRFTESISTARKEGSHFAGLLLTQMVALASTEGRRLLNSHGIPDIEIDRRIYALELLNGMEEFLKYSGTKKQVGHIKKMCVHFVNVINLYLKRVEGAGNVLIKVHLYFHLAMYIAQFGPSSGFDSAPSETNHKTEIKAPAKRTQLIGSTLIKQTCERHMEYRRIDRLHREFPMFRTKQKKKLPGPTGRACGSRFVIGKNASGPYMTWQKTQFPAFHPEVMRFCCEEVLPVLEDSQSMNGFTEHERYDSESLLRFRAHPSYRSDSGQIRDVWYDWAWFEEQLPDEDEEIRFPAQIMCFLHLPGPFTGRSVSGFRVECPGSYAVVRCMETPKKINSKSGIEYHKRLAFLERGRIKEGLFLFPCTCISEEVAVVQDRGKPDHYFVVKNRTTWVDNFRKIMVAVGQKSFESLYKEGKYETSTKRRVEAVPENSITRGVPRTSTDEQEEPAMPLPEKIDNGNCQSNTKKRKGANHPQRRCQKK